MHEKQIEGPASHPINTSLRNHDLCESKCSSTVTRKEILRTAYAFRHFPYEGTNSDFNIPLRTPLYTSELFPHIQESTKKSQRTHKTARLHVKMDHVTKNRTAKLHRIGLTAQLLKRFIQAYALKWHA